jgi:hypothetical protein
MRLFTAIPETRMTAKEVCVDFASVALINGNCKLISKF